MLTVIAMAGMQTHRIELGTAVVPNYPRHPVALAQQAHPVRHIEEYLSVLRPLLQESGVDFQGREFRVSTELQIPDADMVSCPVVMAALDPRMLEIAGRLTDGTVTWMTGPITLRDHVIPLLQESAEAAGNPPPRVCVGLPVAVNQFPQTGVPGVWCLGLKVGPDQARSGLPLGQVVAHPPTGDHNRISLEIASGSRRPGRCTPHGWGFGACFVR